MKQLLWLLLFIPVFLSAQEENRYLAGAVPVENGKVVFSKELNLPGYSKDQAYDLMLTWANQHFNTPESRVVYADREKGEIACVSEEYLVFSSTALSLDRTRVNYRVTIECRDQASHIELTGIRYEYDVSYQREPEKYTAEEWITDKYALNKAQTKLNRISGKFRRETIHLADRTFQSLATAAGEQMTAQQATAQPPVQNAPQTITATPATPITPTTPITPATPITSATPITPATPATPSSAASPAEDASMEGYVLFEAEKVPSALLDLLPSQRMTLRTVQTPAAVETSGTWKGIGDLFGKKTASVGLPMQSAFDQSTGLRDTFRIAFSKAPGETPWMIIECSKQGETPEGAQKTVIGEILHIWIK